MPAEALREHRDGRRRMREGQRGRRTSADLAAEVGYRAHRFDHLSGGLSSVTADAVPRNVCDVTRREARDTSADVSRGSYAPGVA